MSATLQHCIPVFQTMTLLLSLQVMGEAALSTMTQIKPTSMNLCWRFLTTFWQADFYNVPQLVYAAHAHQHCCQSPLLAGLLLPWLILFQALCASARDAHHILNTP